MLTTLPRTPKTTHSSDLSLRPRKTDPLGARCQGACSWLLDGVPEGVGKPFQTHCRRVRYGVGETVFHEGDPVFGVYLLCAGRVKCVKRTVGGKKIILAVAGPGEALGLDSAFGHGPHASSAEALEPVTLHFVDRQALRALLQQAPEVAVRVNERLAWELAQAQTQLLEAAYAGSLEKLSRVLLALARRFGTPAQVSGRVGVALGVTLSRCELAELAGLSPETTIRILQKFRRRGWLALRKQEVVLLDEPALQGLVESELRREAAY